MRTEDEQAIKSPITAARVPCSEVVVLAERSDIGSRFVLLNRAVCDVRTSGVSTAMSEHDHVERNVQSM